MATLPATIVNFREAGAASWGTAVGGQFQATDGVKYEICCVKPSAIVEKTWVEEIAQDFLVSDGAGGFEQFMVSDGAGGFEAFRVQK